MGKHFLWDPVEDNIVKEIDDSGSAIADYTTEPYLYGDLISQHRDGQSRFYHYDGQGSTASLTDSAGNATDTYAYSAFGEVTEHTGNTVNPFQYIGQKEYRRDTLTNEDHVRQRILFGREGRWRSADPLAAEITLDMDGSYIYVRDNPVSHIDPSGLYIADFEPTSYVGVPWCEVPGQRAPTGQGLPQGVYAQTVPLMFGIHCACRCVKVKPPTYKLTCTVFLRLQVLIAPQNISGRIDKWYGHEQYHVMNFLEAANQVVINQVFPVEQGSWNSFAGCDTVRSNLESAVYQQIFSVIEAQRKHILPVPKAGQPYDPIGPVPPKASDCSKMRGVILLEDLNCCEIYGPFL